MPDEENNTSDLDSDNLSFPNRLEPGVDGATEKHSPLLSKNVINGTNSINQKSNVEKGLRLYNPNELFNRRLLLAEARELFSLAWPIIAAYTLTTLQLVEDQIFLGHIGQHEFQAAALGNTYYNIGWYFLSGCTTAADTLISQAYGAGDRAATKYWTNMTLLCIFILSIPIALLFAFSPYFIEHVFRQTQDDAKLAGQYCQLLIPGFLFALVFLILQRALLAQQVLYPPLYILLLTNIVNVAGNFFFIYYCKLGFQGSPIATSTSRFLSCLLLGGYYYYKFVDRNTSNIERREGRTEVVRYEILPHEEEEQVNEKSNLVENSINNFEEGGNNQGRSGHDNISTESYSQDVSPTVSDMFFKFMFLAIPGGFMTGLESWAFDTSVVFASLLPNSEQPATTDAHQSMLTISALTFLTFALPFSIVVTVRVGSLLGSQDPTSACRCAIVANSICTLGMGILSLTMYLLRNDLGKIFTNDETIVNIVSRITYIVAIFQLLDGNQAVAGGTLRGIGAQKSIALLNFFCFWCLGIPIGLLLAFNTQIGVAGIWWGFTIALGCCTVIYAILYSRIDWNTEARRALKSTLKANMN